MAEQFDDRPDYLFMQALQDAAMTAPGGTGPLFDPAIFDIRLGGDNAVNGPANTLTLPLQKVIVTIGQSYGIEQDYMSDEAEADEELWIPFKVWGNTGSDTQDFEKRIDFMRDRRASVFSNHRLTVLGGLVRRHPIVYDQTRGLVAREFGFRFHFTRSS